MLFDGHDGFDVDHDIHMVLCPVEVHGLTVFDIHAACFEHVSMGPANVEGRVSKLKNKKNGFNLVIGYNNTSEKYFLNSNTIRLYIKNMGPLFC